MSQGSGAPLRNAFELLMGKRNQSSSTTSKRPPNKAKKPALPKAHSAPAPATPFPRNPSLSKPLNLRQTVAAEEPALAQSVIDGTGLDDDPTTMLTQVFSPSAPATLLDMVGEPGPGEPESTGLAPVSPAAPVDIPSTSGRDGPSEPPTKRARLAPPFRGPTARTFSRQVHDLFLVLDLEATCTRRRDLFPIEIIELSALLLDAHSLATRGEFQSYVRPTEHPRLDPFCVELTGIQQDQVDTAPLLADVLPRLQQWLEGLGALQEGTSLLPVTWTDWDLKVCLESECEWRKLPRPPYLRRWCNLKRLYTSRYRRTNNLRKCVEAVGLRWQGRLHSGLDDSRNTAALAVKMIRDGCVLRVTDSFKEPPSPASAPQPPPQQEPGVEAAGQSQEGSEPQHQRQAEVGEGLGGSPERQPPLVVAPGSQPSGDEAGVRGRGTGGGSGAGGGKDKGRSGGGGSGTLRQTVLTLTVVSCPTAGKEAAATAAVAAAAAATTAASMADGSSPSPAATDGGGATAAAVALGAAVASSTPEVSLYDSAGRWLGRCRCGVAAHFRTTKKPGANHGRQFYSCGRWTISDRSRQCDFFAWADQLQLAPGAAAVGLAAGGGAGGGGRSRGSGSRSGGSRRQGGS